jgi:glucan phosphoethanolaminetransferase (alkaline phosphatase superfamily)
MLDDLWTRLPIWLALIAYGASVTALLCDRYAVAKWLWTIGCGFYLMHVAFAFHIHYAWNHQTALTKTIDQTRAQTGFETSLGIYFNYAFTLIWCLDVMYWWWAGTKTYRGRRKVIAWSLHLFFLFMVVNGAIVFASGPARWLGIAVVTLIGFGCLHSIARPNPLTATGE